MLRAQHPSPWHASRNSTCNNRLGESSVEDFVRDRFGEPVVPFDVMHLQGLIGCKRNDTAERLASPICTLGAGGSCEFLLQEKWWLRWVPASRSRTSWS